MNFVTVLFLTFGIILISGCSLSEQQTVYESTMTGKIITLQQQMSGFSSQIKDLKTEHTQLKEENKKIKKYKNINPSHTLFLDNENNKVDTAEWKIYENKIVGFSLKYPSYINLYSENIFPIPEDESFLITIKVDSIDVLWAVLI